MAYKLRYRPTSGGSWSADIDMATSSTTVTGLTNGTEYQFQARRDNTPSWSGSEPSANATPQEPSSNDNTAPDDPLQTIPMSESPSPGTVQRTADGVYVIFNNASWQSVRYVFTVGGVTTDRTILKRDTSGASNRVLFIPVPRTVAVEITVVPSGGSSIPPFTISAI